MSHTIKCFKRCGKVLAGERIAACQQRPEAFGENGVGFTEVLSTNRVLDVPQAREPKKYSEFSFANYGFQSPDFPLNSCVGEAEPNLPPPLLREHTGSLLFTRNNCVRALAAYDQFRRFTALFFPVWAP